MSAPRALSATAAAWALVLTGADARAQLRHRRPFAPSVTVNYGFDNNSGGGCRDYNCGGRCYDGHSGTDFGIPFGTPVLAGADGVVIATNNGCANYGYVGNPCGGRCGNYVQLSHADGSRSIFCHMQRDSLAVSRGQRVRCGQTLGRSASSGSSSGPHVHFGWRRTASGASLDSYRGRCTSSPGAWVDQRSYPMSPAGECACVPSAETCNGRDDDCDGRVDDGLSRSCYAGPAGTAGRGVCRAGTETCAGGRWGACAGQVLPRAEACNRLDDDCDGRVDDAVCAMDAGAQPDAARDAPTERADLGADRALDAPEAPAPDLPLVEDTPVTPEDRIEAPDADDAGDADDSGAAEEASAFEDVGPAEDADDVAPDRVDSVEGDCGCRAQRAPGRTPLALFALAALLRWRRRRAPARSQRAATSARIEGC
ncbi:MAG: M23 family metallopeptidase [Deltaproteobacteria bacterium]|nr:M23 family metallopeptidase [Deltaproteobacteria bacterium]